MKTTHWFGAGLVSCVSLIASAASASGPTVKLTTWSFFNLSGAAPLGNVMIDAAGNLIGTTSLGGNSGDGAVFMIAKTKTGYATSTSIVANFDQTDGANPAGGLIADAKGNLFGTTESGGAASNGVVFEIANGASGYAHEPSVLANFAASVGAPIGTLAMDAHGDVFGTASFGGSGSQGAVFELAKGATGYAKTPAVICAFNLKNGATPQAGLWIDAVGNLFGTTSQGGANFWGTAFEVLKTTTGYQSAPTSLENFVLSSGGAPLSGLVADAHGNLFGTASFGGTHEQGAVFELVKVGAGYTAKTLVSFNSANGAGPVGGLILDAAGNLYGTTSSGGTQGGGTVFKIAKTASGYAASPTTLVNFAGPNGQMPLGALAADASGNLFGTTYTGGAIGQGEAFEVSGSGFVGK